MGFFSEIVALLFPSTPPSPDVEHTTAEDIRDALNEQRAKYGKGPLKLDAELGDLAQNWASRMASENHLYHGDFSGRIAHAFPNTAAGEDIAEGQPTVAAVVSAWMASVPHRANILGDFSLLGVGQALAGHNGSIFWVIDFDRPNGQSSTLVAA